MTRFSICSLFLLLFHLAALAQEPAPASLLIREVHYFDSETREFKTGDVLLENGKISQLGGAISFSPEGKTIPGKGKWLIPGLVDSHIHLFQSGGLYTRPDVIDLQAIRSYEEERNWLGENASDLLQRYLKLGITSVVDVGGPFRNFALRDSFRDSPVHPHLYLAGPLISTYQPKALDVEDPPIIQVDGPEAALELVRKQLTFSPDLIKIWYIHLPDLPASESYPMVEAVVREAHQNGVRVAVHATELNTAKLAVKAGADVLVHSVDEPLDQETLAEFARAGVVYVPTLVVMDHYREVLGIGYEPTELDFAAANPFTLGTLYDVHLPSSQEKLDRVSKYLERTRDLAQSEDSIRRVNLNLVHQSGITVASGTDAGNIGTLHGSSFFKELASMKASGMDNADILLASTRNGARVLQQEDAWGSIEPGQRADLVLLNGNPLEDLAHLTDIELVFLSGHAIDPDTLLVPDPAELAQQQLNGYNAHDIDAFVAPYAEDVKIYVFPDSLVMEGKAAMRQRYGELFGSLPELHCELLNRIVQGNTVVDHERITLSADRPKFDAMAIYTIEGGKITKVYFPR